MPSQDVKDLVQRFKNDENDEAAIHLKKLIDQKNLDTPAAKGSALQAIDKGIDSLSDAQLNALALEMINNDVYMGVCPNEWCPNVIEWEDMDIALYDGQCYHCRLDEEKHERE